MSSRTVNIIVSGRYFGAGKTWAGISFFSPGKDPKRLVYDGEGRVDAYLSDDDKDHPELGMFAFDIWDRVYGDDFVKSLSDVIRDVKSGNFPYNSITFDSGTLFQDEMDMAMRDKSTATRLTDALGITLKHSNFLNYRFNPNDTAAYYFLVKSTIRALLLLLRKSKIDVIVTSESKNVWINYGSRDRNNPAKIIGQTAKLWDCWLQMGDLLLCIERLSGSREDGTAKLTPFPTARLDTFNPKCSIPGVAPEFVFKNWNVFWKMVNNRNMPSEEEFGELKIDAVVTPEYGGFETILEAKDAIIDHALKTGFADGRADVRKKLAELGKQNDLDSENALAEYWDWIEAINEAVDGQE